MSHKTIKVLLCLASFGLVLGCTPQTKPDPGPRPPQNLVGSTDQLQLISELALDLSRQYGPETILVVLETDNTLLNSPDSSKSCDGSQKLSPMQEDAAEQVSRIQKAGISVIAMGNRPMNCSEATVSQLNAAGMDFTKTAWPPKGGFSTESASYMEGVLVSQSTEPGEVLVDFLGMSKRKKPLLVIFVNDEQEALNSVMRAFSPASTKVHTWRYTRES